MSFMDELAAYRLKVARDGKEIVNVPGILALPGVLIAPKMSIIGTVAASLLGCEIHLENEDGKKVNVSKGIKDAADTVAGTAKTAAKTVKEEIEKAWDELSADDPEGCPIGEENEDEDEPEDQGKAEEEPPVIRARPEDSEEGKDE